jgi:nucleoid-associated protein YgaU
VQAGDSLETLAQTYYGNRKYAKFLADSNPQNVDPARPAVGTLIKIPPLPADIDTRMATSAKSNEEKAAAPPPTDATGKRTYKVKPGDSFYRIAREQLGNASRWKELLALNKTAVKGDPTQLQVGQTLVLPES